MDLFEYAQTLKEQPDLPEVYTVSEITTEIKEALLEKFSGGAVWVRGEVSNFKGRNQSGHMYFRLKDENAVISCVCFRGMNSRLKFEVEEGMEVIAAGRLDLWDKGGSYQLIVEDLRPGGKGELYLKFEQLKAKLEKEGLFDAGIKKPLPLCPNRIGLITSSTGAVIRDIIHVIRRRCPYVELILLPVKVQGDGSAAEIAGAIVELNKPEHKIDLLIVGRGGGSIEDLWSFNEEVVARAIFKSVVPIISAVGHQTDFTIADFVADVRAATPSQAAELSTPNVDEVRQRVEFLFKSVVRELKLKKEGLQQKLKRLVSSPMLKDPRFMIEARTQNLDYLIEKIEMLIVQKRKAGNERLQKTQVKLHLLVRQFLKPRKMAFERLGSNLAMLNPLSILNRGYSVTKKNGGKILTKSSQVATGDVVQIKLYEGELECEVTKILN